MNIQEKSEGRIVKLTGFSSETLSTLREVFEDVYSVIHQYLEHSQGMSKRMKEEIASISFQADRTKLELDEFIIKWNSLLGEIQKQVAEKKKTKLDSAELLKQSKSLQEKILNLITRGYSFIERVEKSF